MAKSFPLRYVGNDKKHAATLKDGIQWLEPVDAKEVLESGNEDYEELSEEEVPHEHEEHEDGGDDKVSAPAKKARKRR